MNSKMKNLIFILLLSMNCLTLHAQEKHKRDHRSYSEFAPDSIAYLEANFTEDFSYVDRPISWLLEDLEVDIKTIEVDFMKDGRIKCLKFYVQTPEQVEISRQNSKRLPSLEIDFIKPDDRLLYEAIGKGYTQSFIMPWCEDYVKIISHLKVRQVAYY